jgi:hypothetical protein
MSFQCVMCDGDKTEREREYSHVDWCEDCVALERTLHSNHIHTEGLPYYSKPPRFMIPESLWVQVGYDYPPSDKHLFVRQRINKR